MTKNFSTRIDSIKQRFAAFSSPEDRYAHLMELGRTLPAYPIDFRTPEHVVPGCQSILYLEARLKNGNLYFWADSEALISKGLAALLIAAYSGLPPEEILRNPPAFLQEIGLFASLSPNRSNGLAHIYLRMKQEALKSLVIQKT